MLTRLVPPSQPSSQNSQILAKPEMQVLESPMAEKELESGLSCFRAPTVSKSSEPISFNIVCVCVYSPE